jgi:serine/threonine protein kinase
LRHYIDMVILVRMAIPTKIGRYVIKSELGRGGMATVYRAYDPSFEREVAIKVLPREMMHDPQFRARFEREIKLVAALEHPSIVPVYDVGEEDGQPYFVMRFMTGGSLSSRIANGKMDLEETARIVGKIAQGLTYAHKKGIIHRDLKPDNILFDDDEDPFISDFGIAKLTESTSGGLTGSGVMIGTPAYMSPEQATGKDIDGRSDVYGLGVIVYQMLSGQQPYNADTPMGVAIKHVTEPVPEILTVNPTLPYDVDEIIRNSMAKDKTKRYATAMDLAKALNKAAFGNEGNLTSPANTALRSGINKTPTVQSSRGKTGLAVGGIVLVVAVVGFFLLRNQLFAPPPVEPTPTLAPTVIPSETPTEVPTPTLVPATETASPIPFAPACSAGVTIPTPAVKEIDKLCVSKIPYTSITIPEGATFESLDPKMSCNKERTSNGTTTISCTGQQLFSYNLKVCVPPVVSSEDLGKCDQNGIYDSTNQCCLAIPADGAGCKIFKVDIRACG